MPLARIVQVVFKAVLKTGPDQVIGQGDREIVVDKIRKRKGEDMLKPVSTKEGRVEEEIKTDAQKVDDSRVPVEIWDRRAWDYEG